jgi:hypothetical protein
VPTLRWYQSITAFQKSAQRCLRRCELWPELPLSLDKFQASQVYQL